MATKAKQTEPTEEDRIWEWKLDRALAAGLSHGEAFLFANEDGDIHRLEGLLKDGCPADLAVQIAT